MISGQANQLFVRLAPLHGGLRLYELSDNAKVGICVTLRLLEEAMSQAPDDHAWKYFSEQLCQAAHLQSHEELSDSSEVQITKGVAPNYRVLQEVSHHVPFYGCRESLNACEFIVAQNFVRETQRLRSHLHDTRGSQLRLGKDSHRQAEI
jgi:hypothetical protein